VKRGGHPGGPEASPVRKIAPDELDELTPPRPLLRRPCGKKGCRGTARPGGRYCRPCATEAVRRWRDRHATAIAERERARQFSEDQQLIRNARAYVAEYLKRGKLWKDPCEICGKRDVLAAWDDPGKPQAVRWLCSEHYAERREAKRDVQEARVAIAGEWAEVRRQLLLLPTEVQREVHEAALRGPAGQGVRPESVFYWWTLRRELNRYADRVNSGGFWG